MPRINIDYSKTIIYKIQHQENPELLYVGNTTNFVNRKREHKSRCYNENGKKYNSKMYSMMRENGGWDCFKMVLIKEFPCNSRLEATSEEDKVMLELKANMNSYRPYRSKKQYNEDNKEKITEWHKQYNEANKEKLAERKTKYYQLNKEKITEKQKQYVNDNKEKVAQWKKQYHETNKEKIAEYKRKYSEDNKEKLAEYHKHYYIENIEKLKEKLTCDCGSSVCRKSILRHKKSEKHINLMSNLPKNSVSQ